LNELFEIGEIVKTHGLQGGIKLNSFLVEPEKVLGKAHEVFLRREGVEQGPFRIVKRAVYKNTLFLEIAGIDSVDKAASLVGCRVLVPAEHLERLPDGEYYWHELMGMTILTEEGDILGTLSSIFPTGSNDVYVCTGEKGEMLIPAISDVVLQVDRAKRVMIIRLLAGMDKPGEV